MKNISIFFALLLSLHLRGAADFTIGVIPDTQILSETQAGGQTMLKMNQYFVNNKDALNVVWVASLGDMTENYTLGREWQRARDMFDLLTPAGIPWSVCQGNHDNVNSINQWFPPSEFEKKHPNGNFGYHDGIENAYYLFSAGGMDFIILVFNEWKAKEPADQNTVNWANATLAKYKNRRAIFVGHNMSPGEKKLKDITNKHDNVFLTVSGHRCVREQYWTTQSPNGSTQHNITSDYQCDPDGGSIVRYYTFKPAENKVCAFTYSVGKNAFERDADSEFCFDYQMAVPTKVAGEPGALRWVRSAPVMVGPSLDISEFGPVKSLVVHDMSGRKVMARNIASGKSMLNLSGLDVGRFIVTFETVDGSLALPILRI